MASKTQKKKMQVILNKALRFIHCNEEEQLNTFDVHMKYNIAPLNITNYHKALKTIRISEIEQYNTLIIQHNNTHSWFPKCSTIRITEPPEPITTS